MAETIRTQEQLDHFLSTGEYLPDTSEWTEERAMQELAEVDLRGENSDDMYVYLTREMFAAATQEFARVAMFGQKVQAEGDPGFTDLQIVTPKGVVRAKKCGW